MPFRQILIDGSPVGLQGLDDALETLRAAGWQPGEAGLWLRYYPDDRTTKIVLYCRSAHWSAIAAQTLVAAGYTNVWHLDGGMVAWDAAGLPLVMQ